MAQTNLTLLGQANYGGTALGVALSGHYAFLANGTDGLRSLDIMNQTNPISVGHINDGDSAEDVAVISHFAYLADGNDGLRVYDISDPTNIVAIARTNNGGYTYRVAVTTNTCYVGNLDGNVLIYDISNPMTPMLVAYTNVVIVYGMALQGNYLYTADGLRGMHILDVSVPAKPVLLTPNLSNRGDAVCVAVQGHYAFVGSSESGLTVFDVSDPTNPTSIGSGTGGAYVAGVTVSGNYVYAATYNALTAYDATDPENVGLVTQVDTGANAHEVVVAGDYAYVADDSNGLLIYSIGQPVSPQLSIARADTTHIVVSWPAPSAAFSLQQNVDSSTANWITTANSPTVAGNSNQIILPMPGEPTLYRLRFP